MTEEEMFDRLIELQTGVYWYEDLLEKIIEYVSKTHMTLEEFEVLEKMIKEAKGE